MPNHGRGTSQMKHGDPTDAAASRYADLFDQYSEFTMLERAEFMDNLGLVDQALRDLGLAKGSIIECGTWRGGMAAAMIHIGGVDRTYHFFDSFQGLPPAKEIDGQEALKWQRNPDGPRYFNNCTASREEFDRTLDLTPALPDRVHVHEGWFRDTLARAQIGPIAVLRLDGDWYDSTMVCLNTFWALLLPGALVVIDDYACWMGCRRAVHAFLAKHTASECLRVTCPGKVTYLLKD